jgi:outer membrane lipoprotein-sorting protein
LLLLCAGLNAHAQTTDLLHTVLAQLSQHTAVRASFTQERKNPALTQPQNSNGQLLFVAGHGMLWQVQQPYQQTLALTGNKTMSIDATGHAQPVRNERGVSQISQMLQSMLAGQLDAVMRQFDVSAMAPPRSGPCTSRPSRRAWRKCFTSLNWMAVRFCKAFISRCKTARKPISA